MDDSDSDPAQQVIDPLRAAAVLSALMMGSRSQERRRIQPWMCRLATVAVGVAVAVLVVGLTVPGFWVGVIDGLIIGAGVEAVRIIGKMEAGL